MPRFDASDIRRYYDRQTAGFVALGQGGGEGAIHRAVWGPGVTTRDQAFHYVEDRIAEMLAGGPAVGNGPASGGPSVGLRWDVPSLERRGFSPGVPFPVLHVVDLGCGVGGSLCYLASRLPIRGTGITLSPVQARLARDRVSALGLADRVTCIEGDYTRLPEGLAPADLAFAIESFVHGPSPERFFAECARLVKPGGLLVICDDIRRPTDDPRATPALEQFMRGWHVNTLLTADELRDLAGTAGFAHERTTELTPWLELGRPRDRVIAAFVALFGWLPLSRTRVSHVVGGSALQTCLRRGWIGYDLAVFRRP
ncbi:MAG: class I SAM-dependent methyltransferase [Acidobacteria bacterium]|nr:class I SAM-dependent methyltransferase [Acidobacteriota bacterium]